MELLVTISIISILAALLLPSLSKAKAKAHQIKCLSNLRQLGMAAQMYADDHDGEYPPRRVPPEAWPHKLKPYYLDWQILMCPSDRFGILGLLADENNPKRSFLINGFNDVFMTKLEAKDYAKYTNWVWPHGMKVQEVTKPSETVLFGEKRTGSFHVHMDLNQGQMGNDVEEIDHVRHAGGSNFAFVDGSVRRLQRNQELTPENLWGVLDDFRRPLVNLK